MKVTIADLENNLDKYLDLAMTEDIYIIKNGQTIAKISSPCEDRIPDFQSLFGIIPSTATLEEGKEERLNKIISN